MSVDYLIGCKVKEENERREVESGKAVKNSAKNTVAFVAAFSGVGILLLIFILSFFVPAEKRVFSQYTAEDFIVFSPTEPGEFAPVGGTVTNQRFETVKGDLFAFINTYYLHFAVVIAFALIIWGTIKIVLSYKRKVKKGRKQ